MPDELATRVAVLEADLKYTRRALKLQAKEYKRRLKVLNGENRRIGAIQTASVSAEKFEDYRKTQETALDIALDRQDGRLTSLEQWKARATGVGVVLVLVSGVIGAAVMRALGT